MNVRNESGETCMPEKFWLFKSEPGAYSFDDLVNQGVGHWDGVRNYAARNFLRDEVQVGDHVLFYHSNTDPLAVVGIAQVVRAGYPDHTAWDPTSEHPDPKSTPEKPLWYMVDLCAVERLAHPVTMEEMRAMPVLDGMVLLKNSRLSIQPVAADHFHAIRTLGQPMPIAHTGR